MRNNPLVRFTEAVCQYVGGSEEDAMWLPPTMISVNECDPLRDEGINFYRLLMQAGVNARCRQVMGTVHATEIFPIACPEISRETAASIASFCASPVARNHY